MFIHILTIFPNYFTSPFEESLIKKAKEKKIIEIFIHNLRDYTTDKHKTVDDYPYGGGPGMVIKPQPIINAIRNLPKGHTILLTPKGEVFSQKKAFQLSKKERIIFICGRYEGVDERVVRFVDEELSIGDYVVMGGESACIVIIEAIVRLLSGVVGNPQSIKEDSFCCGILSYPVYTRPREFEGMSVPKVLLSGDNEKISKWRRREALKITLKRKPYLLKEIKLSQEDLEILKELKPQL